MPAATDVFVLDLIRASAAFSRLPVEVRALARLCDGKRDVAAICASSSRPPAMVQQVLERLRSMGIITPQKARSDFTDEEEQFFASSIDHLVDEDAR